MTCKSDIHIVFESLCDIRDDLDAIARELEQISNVNILQTEVEDMTKLLDTFTDITKQAKRKVHVLNTELILLEKTSYHKVSSPQDHARNATCQDAPTEKWDLPLLDPITVIPNRDVVTEHNECQDNQDSEFRAIACMQQTLTELDRIVSQRLCSNYKRRLRDVVKSPLRYNPCGDSYNQKKIVRNYS